MKGGFGLQIEITDTKVFKILNDNTKLIKTIGMDMARLLMKRIAQIQASSNFKEYLDTGLGKPHPLVGNLDNCFGISLNKNYRLIVEPLSEKLDDESLRLCEKINLKGVADYHDGKCEWIIP